MELISLVRGSGKGIGYDVLVQWRERREDEEEHQQGHNFGILLETTRSSVCADHVDTCWALRVMEINTNFSRIQLQKR